MSTAITWSAQPGHCSSQLLAQTLADYVPFSVLDTGGAAATDFTSIMPLGDIIYTDLSWSNRELVRRAHTAVPANGEYFSLGAVRSGGELLGINGDTHRLTAGDVVLWNCQAATLLSVPSTLRKSGLLIPAPILEHLSLKPAHGAALTYLTDAPTAPLLRQLLVYLGDLPRPLSPFDRRTRNALLELALGTIEFARDAGATSLLPALRTAVCRWIDDRIFDPELNPRTIAAAHSVSVRTLHRAFQSEPQTLSEVISVRKLEKARDLLWDGRTVTSVSAMLNFANPSHFSRVFTSQYEMTPSEYKQRVREGARGQVSVKSA
jgi:AraC family transcriptional regulator, positive regulator of tynA and feaB